MKHGQKLLALLMALTLVMLPLAGCADEGEDVQEDGQQNGQEDGQQEGTDQLRDVTVILDYTVNTNHTGIYVAQSKGFFADEGLDVEIVQPADASSWGAIDGKRWAAYFQWLNDNDLVENKLDVNAGFDTSYLA